MGDSSEDLLACLATEPWRPQSLRKARTDSLPLRVRAGLLLAVVFLHSIGAWIFLGILAREPPTPDVTVLVLGFTPAPPARPEPRPTEQPEPPAPVSRIRPLKKRVVRPLDPVSPGVALQALPQSQAQPQPRLEWEPTIASRPRTSDVPPKLQLYNPDGSLRLPGDMLGQIDKVVGDKRVFSYQIPHMDDAHKYFDRNPALVYEKTRFDQYWTPDQDLLTGLLTKLVEKTTKEIRIPVPGVPGSTMVCTISILALGGGCGVITNGADYVGPVDDPDTLSPEEDRQCAAWWNQIIDARTQDVWRKTRALYEQECRKPLLKAR